MGAVGMHDVHERERERASESERESEREREREREREPFWGWERGVRYGIGRGSSHQL